MSKIQCEVLIDFKYRDIYNSAVLRLYIEGPKVLTFCYDSEASLEDQLRPYEYAKDELISFLESELRKAASNHKLAAVKGEFEYFVVVKTKETEL